MVTRAVGRPRRGSRTVRVGSGAYLTLPLGAYALQRTIPSVRGGVTSPSPRRPARQSRNVDRDAIGVAARLVLRTRLTPG